ncbi:hypothetical protein SAMN04489761_3084 [Tenacibaculum sp. MAR_2009_124]|uniref:hypothetical protein n=1 Tax=Tenacibaculum sp. MAR_2009_124 TaxID=1250059 RepID=UPI0008995864|nr:hypothetical protein [Tenacibaculum sp. MAR_2009_124]SEC47097.1 hypothetical protein SAMN04489761_3084 [Tenacibaculum sp. MAR_2009_124]
MKTKQLLLLICLTLSFAFVSCSNEEEIINRYKLAIKVTHQGQTLENASVRIYESIKDLRNKENHLFEGNTDKNGFIEFKENINPDLYFAGITKPEECLSNRFSVNAIQFENYEVTPTSIHPSDHFIEELEVEKTIPLKLNNKTGLGLLIYTYGDDEATGFIEKDEMFFYDAFPINTPEKVKIKYFDTVISIDHITQGSCEEITTYELH